MVKTKSRFTYEDYKSLPDDKRYELLEGELVMVPSPRELHQRIARNLGFILWELLRGRGEVYLAPFDVVLAEDTVVQPDIIFIAEERADIITADNVRGAPDLIIEILSENTAERDRIAKRLIYAKYGVKEYWLVDPQLKNVEVLQLKEQGYETVGVWWEKQTMRSPLLNLEIDLNAVF